MFLSGYDFDIKYVKSCDNSTDTLSRLPLKVSKIECNKDLADRICSYLYFIEESSVHIPSQQVGVETRNTQFLKRVVGYVMYGWSNYLSDNEKEL